MLTAGTKLGRYEIRSKIGEGGMGEVYLAEDTKLHRRVAIKLLPVDSIGNEEANQRLVREAQAAARLDHPNICAVYEVASENGRRFIVMQYVEGETLDVRMNRKALEVSESLALAAQVADALAEAHAHGIVHRDIKPSNIIITPRGQAKVTDFGLAKLSGAHPTEGLRVDTEASTRAVLTTPGMIIGTLPYMSPEQVHGQTLDARTDIFSFGAVLYEILTHEQPFAAESPAGTLSAILTKEPAPLTNFVAHCSEEVQRIVSKCLEKDRQQRYQSMCQVHEDLLEAIGSNERKSKAVPEARTALLDASLSKRSRATRSMSGWRAVLLVAGVVITVVASLALVYEWRHTATTSNAPITSLAVLPFVNVNGNPDTDYLSDGLTESIIDRLSQLPNLKVMSRNSVVRYKGKEVDAREVGQQLGVQSVLTGRVSEHTNTLSINLELVDARDGSRIWGAPYDRKLSDLVSVQREIPVEVADNLRIRLSGEERQNLTKRYTDNSDAYRLYLKGRYFWDKRTPESMDIAIDAYDQAIALDQNYALAYDGLADCYLFNTLPNVTHREAMLKAKESVLRAIGLDDTLAEAHTTLGFLKENFDYDPKGAESEFRRAIELNPKYPIAHQFYGGFLVQTGHEEEGLAEARQALELDPYSLALNWYLGHCLYMTRHYDEAVAQLQKTLQMQANYHLAQGTLGQVYVQLKRYDEALALFRPIASQPATQAHGLTNLAYVYARTNRRAEAEKLLNELLDTYAHGQTGGRHVNGEVNAYFIAQVYAGLGDRERAFEWLNKGLDDHAFFMFFLRAEPLFDELHDDPRFQDLLRRIGLVQ